jgi:hypothetical protein
MIIPITSPNVPAATRQQAHALYLEMESCLEANSAGGTNQLAHSVVSSHTTNLNALLVTEVAQPESLQT